LVARLGRQIGPGARNSGRPEPWRHYAQTSGYSFVSEQADRLVADVLIASDGPRVMPEVPTIATGTRGIFHFDLVVNPRPGGVHSGHWGA
jgi:hypothetical protein